MNTRERRHEERPAPAAGGGTPGNLDALASRAERLLAAGDEAIDRALSGRSEDFLRANRQRGGE